MSCALVNVNRSDFSEPDFVLLLGGIFSGRGIVNRKLAKGLRVHELCQCAPAWRLFGSKAFAKQRPI